MVAGMSVTQLASNARGLCDLVCSLLPRLQAYQLTAGLLGLALESWGLGASALQSLQAQQARLGRQAVVEE